jgi:hypothetical protein
LPNTSQRDFDPDFTAYLKNHTWLLPSHPGEPDYDFQDITPLNHDPTTMPPLSHILRFYTSHATLFIDPEPDLDFKPWEATWVAPYKYHRLCLPSTSTVITHVLLSPDCPSKGKEGRGFYPPSDARPGDTEELLNIMWI